MGSDPAVLAGLRAYGSCRAATARTPRQAPRRPDRGVFLLVALSPLIGLIAWRIRCEDGGPVFFRQERAGKGGRLFQVWKFRSMMVGADRVGLGLNIAAGDERITRTGHLLRNWSLDELPQL